MIYSALCAVWKTIGDESSAGHVTWSSLSESKAVEKRDRLRKHTRICTGIVEGSMVHQKQDKEIKTVISRHYGTIAL